MDMAIVSAPAVPAAQTKSSTNASDSSTAAASGSDQFSQKLAGSMKNQSGSNTAATAKTEASSATATEQSTATQQADPVVQLTAEQLVAAIGELLQALQNNADEQQTDDSNAQDTQDMLQQMLDQLNAMLTLLGVQPIQPLPQVPGFEVEDLKVDVAQALVQLQQTIERGQLGSAKLGNSLEWMNSQLSVLQQSMEQMKAAGVKQEAPKVEDMLLNSASQQSGISEAASAPVQTTTMPAKTATLLDQLNRSAVSPNLLQVIAGQQHASEKSDEPAVSAEEAPIAINLNAQAPEAARTVTMARTTQIPQQVPAQQFAETMANLMVNKFEVKTATGMSEAKLTLTPEHLGQVDVRISVQNGQLTALFLTDTSAAKDMLDNQLALLRANLQSQGLSVDKLEVSQQSVDSQMAQQQGNGSGRQQSERGSGASDGSEPEQSSFESELAEQTVIRGLGFGRGINVRA